LIALAKLYSISDATIADLNKLSAESWELNNKRNRIVHDAFMIHDQSGHAIRMEVTADKQFKSRFHEATIDGADVVAKEIRAFCERLFTTRTKILAEARIQPILPNAAPG